MSSYMLLSSTLSNFILNENLSLKRMQLPKGVISFLDYRDLLPLNRSISLPLMSLFRAARYLD
ncbi:hypothetical protein DB41_AA00230 [Neochlamydia sp. TUME1]|nr:hypothetical protein DB41_AA00230 [Neochlamydia sp. TUME1]